MTTVEGTCQYLGCDLPATHIAAGRRAAPDYGKEEFSDGYFPAACYCLEHAQLLAEQEQAEYPVECPNCGCQFGVG